MAISVRVQDFQSIEDVTLVLDGFTVITGPNNSGKALAHGTLVSTPCGWVPVEAIRSGDLVISGDGSPTRVLGVYPQGRRETCRITFNDGRSTLVDWDHLWSVAVGEGRFTDPKQYTTLTTRELVDRVGRAPRGGSRPAVPCAGPVQYEPSDLPLDPYLMGILLGDGCFQPTSVRVSSADDEIVDAVRSLVPEGVSLIPCGKYDFRIVGRGWRDNPVLDGVRGLGLGCARSYEKHVPALYLRSSVSDRVSLLQGLMDTDGTVNVQGVAEFCSASRSLAEAVREIALSLGGTAMIRDKVPTYSHKGEVRKGRRSFTVTMRVPGFDLFRLTRKLSLVRAPKRSVNPLMVSFEDGPVSDCSCIEVEHPSHLFQIEGHIVTHNTALMRAVKGVFTNSAPGPLVRHGAAHLIVTIDFGDGTEIVWKKGWGKADRKGGTINYYKLTKNGVVKEFNNVGASPPDEVLELGFGPFKVGDQKLWPQVADQFEGVLFLIGAPGSMVAEAVADVERVGQLNKALREVESDKRTVRSTLKVRRTDKAAAEADASKFEGLCDVSMFVDDAEAHRNVVVAAYNEVDSARKVALKLATRRGEVDKFIGLDNVNLPDDTVVKGIAAARSELRAARASQEKLSRARDTLTLLTGVEDITVPDVSSEVQGVRADLAKARQMQGRVAKARSAASGADLPELDLPDETAVEMAQRALRAVQKVRGLRDTLTERKAAITAADTLIEAAAASLSQAEAEVHEILGEHGECPICGSAVGAA